jgi:serine/threonine protein kinase
MYSIPNWERTIDMATNNQSIYNLIALKGASLEERLDRGANGSLSLYGEDSNGVKYLLKETKPGENPKLLENELMVYRHLYEEGASVPILHEDYVDDSYGRPNDLAMQLINNAATLGDYAEGYVEGKVPLETFKEMIKVSKGAIESMHNVGVIHNDLHANNIVLALVNNQWKAYVIDFGWSYFQSKGVPKWMARERTWIAEDEEADLQYLQTDLEGRLPADDPDFLEVTGLLTE